MYSKIFEFNGIRSDDIGFYIMSFDGFNNDGVGVAGNEITFNTSKPPNTKKWNFHGSKYETQLNFTFQIGKYDCKNPNKFTLSQEECAFLIRWLVRSDGYKYLRFFQEGYEHTYFNAQINLQWIRITGDIIGAELNVTCDAPYAYSELKTFEMECSDGGSFQIYNDSDEVGEILFDETTILMTSNAPIFKIENNLDALYSPTAPYSTIIKNCTQGENIIMSNRQITTSNHNHNIIDDFNMNYPRLINLSKNIPYHINNNYPTYQEERINTYTVSGGSARLFFSYRTARKVIP